MKKFKPIKRNCKYCGKTFTAIRSWHIFCPNNGKCRIAYYRKTHPYLSPEELKEIKSKLGIKT